ncbi:hypothetical protein A6770_06300 [Nostoc minutum NIES-26]|uniref:Uncharacterized protein n=1 Tax=Nostoc minutum NIES-26 TaxID=1844469 RepID=A0A367Q4G7_9NOSO|nr:hypothetical protein A6770_06300 [Nostoc minutum NIES-26]
MFYKAIAISKVLMQIKFSSPKLCMNNKIPDLLEKPGICVLEKLIWQVKSVNNIEEDSTKAIN